MAVTCLIKQVTPKGLRPPGVRILCAWTGALGSSQISERRCWWLFGSAASSWLAFVPSKQSPAMHLCAAATGKRPSWTKPGRSERSLVAPTALDCSAPHKQAVKYPTVSCCPGPGVFCGVNFTELVAASYVQSAEGTVTPLIFTSSVLPPLRSGVAFKKNIVR